MPNAEFAINSHTKNRSTGPAQRVHHVSEWVVSAHSVKCWLLWVCVWVFRSCDFWCNVGAAETELQINVLVKWLGLLLGHAHDFAWRSRVCGRPSYSHQLYMSVWDRCSNAAVICQLKHILQLSRMDRSNLTWSYATFDRKKKLKLKQKTRANGNKVALDAKLLLCSKVPRGTWDTFTLNGNFN